MPPTAWRKNIAAEILAWLTRNIPGASGDPGGPHFGLEQSGPKFERVGCQMVIKLMRRSILVAVLSKAVQI
eukprot:1693336-Amphidinium_carterae.2